MRLEDVCVSRPLMKTRRARSVAAATARGSGGGEAVFRVPWEGELGLEPRFGTEGPAVPRQFPLPI